jgi:2-oxoglutarate ferredoxin oxidoreductase subunit beta|uniref:2-oxoacid ferredoxin oxidoreductase n=1 Tax=Mesoaciditoga lauensis TaxID=1495039 RepID=A0A7V3RDF2_9BACT
MDKKVFDMGPVDIAWCPGCGDYGILNAVKQALAELEIPPEKLVMVSGIGQAAKLPHYLKSNFFNGLHGRSIPPATGIKVSNPDLVVIAESGDGDVYGEGGNHFLHAIRRNPDITVIVHDNMVYGLTKGQASPTSREGFKTPVQVEGVILEPFNPLAVAIADGATFVARASITDIPGTVKILKQAIQHKGFSLVDLFQPCVTFNKFNTYQWFKDNTYYLEDSYDPHDRVEAFKRAIEDEKFPLGVFYVEDGRKTFEERTPAYEENKVALYRRDLNLKMLADLVNSMRES